MEKVMRLHLTVIAGLLAIAAPATAEPAKADSSPHAQPQQGAAPIVLASADSVHAVTTPQADQPAPAKRRIARVTNCRCGAPQPDAEQQEQ